MGIAILGAGGMAREVFWYLQHSDYKDFFFVDEFAAEPAVTIRGKSVPVIKNWDFSKYTNFKFIVGVGNPKTKRILVEKALKAGLLPAPTFIHPKAVVEDAQIGVGGIIAPGCVVTCNVQIGNYVILNFNSTVGHDSVIGDFVQANPGCHISGNVVVEEDVDLGTGTVVIQGLRVGKGVVTGAQATVVKNILGAGTYVGVPAKPIGQN